MTERDRALEALVVADDGTRVEPVTDADWAGWVTATATRNHLKDDALVDWLELHGARDGFVRDRDLPGADPRLNMGEFLMERGIAFEAGVVRLLEARWPVTRIAEGGWDARRLEAAAATVEAMRAGAPVIAQGVLRNPTNRTVGLVDLLVRSDVLESIVPGTLEEGEASIPAPALGGPWHYRVVDVKFRDLAIDRRRRLDLWRNLHLAGQVWIYNEALGRIQGYLPPASYLLGRSWSSPGDDGRDCFGRLGHVPHDAEAGRRAGTTVAARVEEALAWVRRVRTDGAGWSVLPSPTIDALRPTLSRDTSGWSDAKGRIAAALADVTLVKGVSPSNRTVGLAAGVSSWRDERASAELLGVREGFAATCDAILAANRSTTPVLLPDRLEVGSDEWRTPARVELYVDIETTGDMNDDLSRLPERGGQPLIFQIGCGRWVGDAWAFEQWTADRLTPAAERTMIERFLAHVDALRREAGASWEEVRLGHWYDFEPPRFAEARERHPDLPWPTFSWYDFLARVVEPGPVAVTGAFTHQLKPLGKAMHALGMVETTWVGEVGGGSAAEVAGFRCDEEAARTGGSMNDVPLMDEVKRYNEVDCRVMAEIVRWLRENR